ncbi:hypothetical protein VTN00DRAFT_8119 [Thermoascus crustaceus]|uniref:uncharacterized protein n=1 Tax=Thermoascus crustaceus TaxID=5088 RepID=UPI0037425D6A
MSDTTGNTTTTSAPPSVFLFLTSPSSFRFAPSSLTSSFLLPSLKPEGLIRADLFTLLLSREDSEHRGSGVTPV